MADVAAARPLALAQTGIILFVERYEACVAFYRDVLGLSVVSIFETLTIFAFGAGYLEIERGGIACDGVKPRDANPTILRFDVDDLDATIDRIAAAGVAIRRCDFDWGSIGAFADPDGNRCEVKRHDARQTVLAMSDD